MCLRDTAADAGFSCRTDAGFSGRNGCRLLLPHRCGLSLTQWMRALPQRMRASPAARMRAATFFISSRSGCGFCRNGCGLHLPQRMRASPAATYAGFTCRKGCGLLLPHGCGLSLPQWKRSLPQRMRASSAARMRASFFLFPAAADAGFAATDTGFTCRDGCGLRLPQRMRALALPGRKAQGDQA